MSNAVVELMRPCRDPLHEGDRWLPATAEFFYGAGRLADGSRKLGSYCKPCARRKVRARQRGVSRSRSGYFRDYRRDVIQADPEKRADRNEYQRARKRAAARNPQPHLWLESRGSIPVEAAPIIGAVAASPLTHAEIARRAGIDESTLRHMRLRQSVRLGVARKILRVLGLTFSEVGL